MGAVLAGKVATADAHQLVLYAHHRGRTRVEMQQVATVFDGHSQQLRNVITELVDGRVAQLLIQGKQKTLQLFIARAASVRNFASQS